jgi:sulfur-oxidizing protein SoxX
MLMRAAALVIWVAAAHLNPVCAAEPQLEHYEIAGDAIPKPLGGLKGDAARGEGIVRDRRVGNCLICHKFPFKDEPFQGEMGPSMIGVGSRLSEGQIRLRLVDESILNPNTMMPPYYRVSNLTNVAPEYAGQPALTAQQLEDVVAYLTALRD